MVKLLNIGCGSTFHPAWTNIDLISFSSDVQAHDIRKGLPYPDAYFDGCYSSHLIEHLTPGEAKQLITESFRVLKFQGVVRVVVPDLEAIVRVYLDTLEQVEAGVIEAEPNYDWIMLELYDQTVRHFGGGEMGRYLLNHSHKNKYFILSRIGFEAESWMSQPYRSIWEKIKSRKLSWFIQKGRVALAGVFVRLIAGRTAQSGFEEGIFRTSGEIHRWMYDRFSLRRLLKQAGFVDISVCQADQSRIPDFNSYNLDMLDGKIRKLDSLFVEGIKP